MIHSFCFVAHSGKHAGAHPSFPGLTRGLIPQNFGCFFHKQPLSSAQENAGNVFQTRIRNGTWRSQKPGALGSQAPLQLRCGPSPRSLAEQQRRGNEYLLGVQAIPLRLITEPPNWEWSRFVRILNHFFGNHEDRDHKQLAGEQIRTNSLRICSFCTAGE